MMFVWNILKNEMSFIGPRPEKPEFGERLSSEIPFYEMRSLVKPGITGWAQVNGRNAVSWEERFRLDVWYVDHRSLWIDLRIMFMTLSKVFLREGISAPGSATMPAFTGRSRESEGA